MKNALVAVLLTLLVIISISCKENGVVEPEPQPGRRDYVWTVDTVKVPQDYLWSIWGSGSDDVWAVTGGGYPDKKVYHFNGNKWNAVESSAIGFPNTVFGLSKQNIFTAGSGGEIWNYNGTTWKEIYSYPANGRWVELENIWGVSNMEIYAVGFIESTDERKGLLLRYDGIKWQEIIIPAIHYDFHRVRKGKNGNYYIFGSSPKDSVAVFEFDGKNIKPIYKAFETDVTIQSIDGDVYFIIGKEINTYDGKGFISVVRINDSMFRLQTWGRTEKDIFLSMFNGIAHYNGTNIQYLFEFPYNQSGIVEAAVFEKDVFFLGLDFKDGINLIYHGKLK